MNCHSKMNIFEQKEVLKTFEILVDTREQDTVKKAEKGMKNLVFHTRKKTLSYGDYTYNLILPNGTKLYDNSETISPICAVERKMNLDELAGCFTRSRQRFQREFERALDNHCRIYLLCENSNWENLLNGKYRSKFHPKAFAASTIAWMIRYNLNVTFLQRRNIRKAYQRSPLQGC